MEEDKKVLQDFPFELFVGRHGTWPNCTGNSIKKKIKNVTPKAPVQLELPFEEFKNAKE